MPTRPRARQSANCSTADDTTASPASCPSDATFRTTVATKSGITAATPNSDKLEPIAPDMALRTCAQAATKSPPPRGATAHMSSLALRDAIYLRALLLANRFRVIRTIDIAALCFPERPFKAALTAAQRAVRGLVKTQLLRRYRTDRFHTVYGLTQRGVDWLAEHGHDATSSIRRVSDMTNPEHRLWAQFLVICAWSRDLDAFMEAELMKRLNAVTTPGAQEASTTTQGYITVDVHRATGIVRKHLRPDAVAYDDKRGGVAWFEVDRSKRGSDRQADLGALIGAIGSKVADGKVLRRVVVMCKSERIERDAVRIVEQLAVALNEQMLIEGRRHIKRYDDGVYEVLSAVPVKRSDGRTALRDELVGHVIVQMLPIWLPKVRLNASNVYSMDGWFDDNYLPYKRPPLLGRWLAPTSPLWPSPDDVDDNDAV